MAVLMVKTFKKMGFNKNFNGRKRFSRNNSNSDKTSLESLKEGIPKLERRKIGRAHV